MGAPIAAEPGSATEFQLLLDASFHFFGRFAWLIWLPFPFCTSGRLLLLAPELLRLRQPGARVESMLTGLTVVAVGALILSILTPSGL